MLTLILGFSCTSKRDSQIDIVVTRYSSSFSFDGVKAEIKELIFAPKDSFVVVCQTADRKLLEYFSSVPSELLGIQNLYGDSIPEIVIDPCLACEMEGLLIFHYNQEQRQFVSIPGSDGLSSDFQKLHNTAYYYDEFYHNRGGQTSTLFKLENDSCKKVASMFLPYDQDYIELQFLLEARTPMRLVKDSSSENDESLVRYWLKAIKYL